MNCPLCSHLVWGPSWVGSIMYRSKVYQFRRCVRCGSLYSYPMPDAETLALMYGIDYDQFLSVGEGMSGITGAEEVIRWLNMNQGGTFIDYGCGAGHLLQEVAKLGWRAIGVEMDQ